MMRMDRGDKINKWAESQSRDNRSFETEKRQNKVLNVVQNMEKKVMHKIQLNI